MEIFFNYDRNSETGPIFVGPIWAVDCTTANIMCDQCDRDQQLGTIFGFIRITYFIVPRPLFDVYFYTSGGLEIYYLKKSVETQGYPTQTDSTRGRNRQRQEYEDINYFVFRSNRKF